MLEERIFCQYCKNEITQGIYDIVRPADFLPKNRILRRIQYAIFGTTPLPKLSFKEKLVLSTFLGVGLLSIIAFFMAYLIILPLPAFLLFSLFMLIISLIGIRLFFKLPCPEPWQ